MATLCAIAPELHRSTLVGICIMFSVWYGVLLHGIVCEGLLVWSYSNQRKPLTVGHTGPDIPLLKAQNLIPLLLTAPSLLPLM